MSNRRHRNIPSADPRFLTAAEWADVIASLPLTPRQAQIVQLLLQAKQQKEIAAELRLSPHTVRAYTRQLLARLGICNQTELLLTIIAHRVRHTPSKA